MRSTSILAFLVLFVGIAGAQSSPTAYIGADLDGLSEALGTDPENIGLRMRIVRRMLAIVGESSDLTENRKLLILVDKQLKAIRDLEPDFVYVYRVFAVQHYRRREYEEFLEAARQYEKVADLDFEMRSMWVKTLLRMASDSKNPQPERMKEAAKYVGDWFDSGAAPLFSDTLGTCAAWLHDAGFRDELLSIFSDRYEKDPDNLNLALSYAGCLYVIGRNERAWDLVHRAERSGMCDDVTGGRHSLVNMLEWRAPEFGDEQTYDGSDVEELKARMDRFPKNACFPHRLALIVKRKAVAAKKVSAALLRKAAELEQTNDPKETAEEKEKRLELITKLRAKNEEGVARSQEFYREALGYALKTEALNPAIDSLPLLLADLHSNLGETKEAIAHLTKTVDEVPFLTQLRIKLAELHIELGQWNEAARQLATVLHLVGCRAADWDDEPQDSLLPKPEDSREKLIVRITEDPAGRKALINALEAAIRAKPRSPNLKVNLAMVHYFAGNKQEATRWMLAAEKDGMCGSRGFEHTLATLIYSRERW